MRVIAGSARRIPLDTPKGLVTRPTTDRIKETLFNIIQKKLPDARFLDLFSGSGAIGIEAMSRGAGKAVFVEQDKAALSAIHANLERTGFADRSQVFSMECLGALKVLAGRGEAFDLIFMDPPYDQEYEYKVLRYLKDTSLIGEEAAIIFEASRKTTYDYVGDLGYEIYKIKEYKTNQHVFLRRKGRV